MYYFQSRQIRYLSTYLMYSFGNARLVLKECIDPLGFHIHFSKCPYVGTVSVATRTLLPTVWWGDVTVPVAGRYTWPRTPADPCILIHIHTRFIDTGFVY